MSCRRFPLVRAQVAWPALVLAAGACWSTAASALTVTVGNGGCQYIGLQFALDELAGQPGPHTVKLKSQSIAIPDGLAVSTASTSYTLIGGHAQCSDANPTPGQRTVLDATGGNDGTAMRIDGTGSSTTPTITLRGVSVRGGNSESGIGANPEGGGLEIRGRVNVRLEDATRIEANTSGRGGGIYLRGDNAGERATLWILGDSRVVGNEATGAGGGIYCAQHGQVLHDHGQVSFNTAGGSGGGAALGDTCRYDAQAQPGSFTGINNNVADLGAGLIIGSSLPLSLRGAPDVPFWISGNSADREGGALVVSGGADSSAPANPALLENVVVQNNTSGGRLGAAIHLIGAVDMTIRARSDSDTCAFFGIGFGACSALVGNRNLGLDVYGVVHLNDGLTGSAPTLTMRRTLVQNNRGINLFSVQGAGGFDIEGSLISGNQLRSGPPGSGLPSALLWVFDAPGTVLRPQRLAYSTVVGTTSESSSGMLFDHARAALDVTGSILHAPGLFGRNSTSTGPVTHAGCLLVHDAAGWPTSPAPPVVGSPGLGSDLTPSMSSPALDQCATAGSPSMDFRGNARAVDQPGTPNRFGPVDLGAIERSADPPPNAPNLQISRSGVPIADGSTTPFVAGVTDFGTVTVGGAQLFGYILQNSGNSALTFSAHNLVGDCAGNFRLSAVPESRPAGTQGFLTIRFEPITPGECVVTYQLFSNDPDNSPYDFQIRGFGRADALFNNGFE
jgi:hypothetical protein